IAVHPIKTPACRALGDEPRRADVAPLVVDVPVREAETADVPVAVEPGRPLVLRRPVLEIALHAEERAFDVLRDLSPDLAVVHVRLETRGAVESPRKHGMAPEIHRHDTRSSPGAAAPAREVYAAAGCEFKPHRAPSPTFG